MNKVKQKFSEIKNAPKRIQWLLLLAAFVVVLILLTIMVGKKENKSNLTKESVIPELSFTPSNNVDFTNTVTGEEKSAKIEVAANTGVIISDVRIHEKINGFVVEQTCKKLRRIDNQIGCSVNLTYLPKIATKEKTIPVYIDWYDEDKTEEMKNTSQIDVKISAVEPQKPEPIAKLQPVATKITQPETEPITKPIIDQIVEPTQPTIQQEIIREVEKIAPPIKPVYNEPIQAEVSEACSDFAFPGYDNSGVQIGWIKPERGAYYFHPFSDKDCDKPTGIYNPYNGIITDIDNRGKRIGSDADHIGYNVISTGDLPQLTNRPEIKKSFRAQQNNNQGGAKSGGAGRLVKDKIEPLGSGITPAKDTGVVYGTTGNNTVYSTVPYDRTFVLRQYKPIPATIVSDVRADIQTLGQGIPVRATVDRNVYSDNGRTIVIPTGTLLMGYVTGEVPGPYKAIGRMDINWYQFIRPDGVEFNFDSGHDPFSADAQGRVGVPGRGSTDYMEQFLMPMLTAFVPAAINLINPVADAFVNQIDLDNNTVVQSGKIRSSELAKTEIITAWNQVAQKLMVDMMDNTVPPFTIAAGTRITVYSPVDLQITCGDENGPYGDKKCAVKASLSINDKRRDISKSDMELKPAEDDSWVGQARSFQTDDYCEYVNDIWRVKEECEPSPGNINKCGGYSYSTLKLWCESLNYQSKKAIQYKAYRADQQRQYDEKIKNLGEGSQQYNEEVLGIKYNEDGTVQNPYSSSSSSSTQAATAEESTMTCLDGSLPDANGCCAGEIYTDMGEQGFNCCPESGGDCFPPII